MANPKSKYKENIIKLRNKGYSYNEISDELGCTKSTISYHLNPNTKNYARDRSRKRRKDTKSWFLNYISDKERYNSCAICKESEFVCLDYHHIFPEDKFMMISEMVRSMFSKEKIIHELEKCLCVCANCHRKIHANIIDVEPYI